ncbi:hypothetical protein AVEN_112508-1 [Araneus ventricosus]|uniref:Uncharacterized protein n=1 Tax=Araneus ventricosus TaxID=182803 RepID=A0A4Y2VIF9_ARAVE|nr:hypothetical protein AVEN_112508-1 [Araneus ventricosus]
MQILEFNWSINHYSNCAEFEGIKAGKLSVWYQSNRTRTNCIMFAKVFILCAALAAAHASLLAAPIISTGVSNRAQTQDTNQKLPTPAEAGDAHGKQEELTPCCRHRRIILNLSFDGVVLYADPGFRSHHQDQRTRNRRQRPAAALVASPFALDPVAPVVNHVAPAAPCGPAAPYASHRLWWSYGDTERFLWSGYGAGIYGAGIAKAIFKKKQSYNEKTLHNDKFSSINYLF